MNANKEVDRLKLQRVVQILLLLVVVSVFYYSWLPDSNMRSEHYLPQWLLRWSNTNFNIRTAVPFVAFGFLLGAYSFYKNETVWKENLILFLFRNLGIATIVVLIAEGGQFLIANRSPDMMDVLYGILGSLIGGLMYQLFNKLIKS
ncbi:VanZ family protein [Flavobacterium algicola]|uniref:VanZ family protein n=1 Tax=Flavobacterium algicola TaxID=556529 RepID=UPI001EFE0789|nr:VanZ family protein [Flavobacterium algicola]MCG9793531.1 VanZ family protein [Flavobacterium algicola]